MYTKETLLDFIKELLSGFDPRTGEKFPGDHILNDPDSIRKLFCIKEVIETRVPNEKIKKVEFAIPSNIMSIVSETSTNISKIVQNINDLKSENMKKIKIQVITDLLIKHGILSKDEDARKIPTEKGKELGIYLEYRVGKRGTYPIVLYPKQAQETIINLLISEYGVNPLK